MKRAGNTEKISISLPREDLRALKKRAKRLYGGNVSAVVAVLAADARLLEGMHELVGVLGCTSVTDEARNAFDAERRAPATKRAPRKKAMASAAARGDVVYTSDVDDLRSLQKHVPTVRVVRVQTGPRTTSSPTS